MSGPTPGSWSARRVKAANGDDCEAVWSESTQKVVAWIDGRDDAEIKANASLIAAVPDLLGALKSIIFQLRDGKIFERDDCITQARAAIAKSTRGAT
jgi:hypothetical protein